MKNNQLSLTKNSLNLDTKFNLEAQTQTLLNLYYLLIFILWITEEKQATFHSQFCFLVLFVRHDCQNSIKRYTDCEDVYGQIRYSYFSCKMKGRLSMVRMEPKKQLGRGQPVYGK